MGQANFGINLPKAACFATLPAKKWLDLGYLFLNVVRSFVSSAPQRVALLY